MTGLIVNVHESPLDRRQLLELDLQVLGDVVDDLEALVAVHDDVDLYQEAGAGVVGADCVDLLDEGGVRHCWGSSATLQSWMGEEGKGEVTHRCR